MLDLLVSICLNLAFWGGIGANHLPISEWQTLLSRLQLVGGAVGLAAAVAGMMTGAIHVRRRSADPGTRRVLGTCSAVALAYCAVYWFLVPYNTQERFLSPALGLALVPLSVVCAASPMFQAFCCAALARQLSPIQLSADPLNLGRLPTTLLLAAAIVAAVVLLQRSGRTRVGLAALLVVIGCYLSARPAAALLAADPVLPFYPPGGFGARLLPGWTILERHAASAGANVAYAGTNLPYYLYGIGLRNRMRYVDINRQQDSLPHEHHRHLLRDGAFRLSHDPYPEWSRAGADFVAWTANLRRNEIDFLFVAREIPWVRVYRFLGGAE